MDTWGAGVAEGSPWAHAAPPPRVQHFSHNIDFTVWVMSVEDALRVLARWGLLARAALAAQGVCTHSAGLLPQCAKPAELRRAVVLTCARP